ncbi:O-antigen ligase family protein [Devriesea agamarum]|uniref:O-antigen ligase family protein n=1 Tax=Devriesea agamarum TaxID=472569 RepID=UPI00071D29C3|nr:O-antigen ligase family protein [Devriesea agamarum]
MANSSVTLTGSRETFARAVSDQAHRTVGIIRIPEFIGGLLLVTDGVNLPELNFPLSLVGVGLLVVTMIVRGSQRSLGRFSVAPVIFALALCFVVAVSITTDHSALASDWGRRALRIGALLLFAFLAAEGRMDLRSLLKGLFVGLIANTVLFYVGVAPDEYGGYLTGYLQDKNKAGLLYSCGGLLLLLLAKSRWQITGVVVFLAATTWLTGSRTSLTGLLVAFVWMLLVTRWSKWPRIVAAVVIMLVVDFVEQNFARVGEFASRLGSDELRGRIDAAASLKTAASPLQGRGLGEAYVIIDDNKWFYHNSYLSLLVEGGWIYALVIVGATVIIGFGPLRDTLYTREIRIAEGAMACLMVCAWKLGEVFLTNTWALVLMVSMVTVLMRDRGVSWDEVSVFNPRLSRALRKAQKMPASSSVPWRHS